MLDVFYWISVVLLILISVFLVLLVLIQKGRGGGLASAFGGGGGNTAFGSKTGDVLTWATSVVFGVFILLAIGTDLLADRRHQARATPPAPAATAPSPSVPRGLPAPAPQVPSELPVPPATQPK